MNWRRLIGLLVPREERRDPRFKAQLERLSVIGLRVIAGVCIGSTLYFMAARGVLPREFSEKFDLLFPFSILTLGIVSLGLSFWSKARPYARLMGMVVGYFVALIKFLNFRIFIETPEAGHFVLSGIVIGIMLVGIAALPLKPLHVLALGAAISATFGVLGQVPGVLPQLSSQYQAQLLFMFEVVLLCTALTAVVYHQRVLAYRARRAAEQAFEELRQAQARLLVSENAASQSRFAAALSHELNTPLGALVSTFDTVMQIYKKDAARSMGPDKLAEILAGAETSAHQSTKRLKETIERMKHLANLDRAEEQVIDLNGLCRATAASLKAELEDKAKLSFELEPLPPLKCRPQQISAVLSNLLRNAAAAIDESGAISVVSKVRHREVVLEVRDDGRGISEERRARLFEPSFHVDGSRVSTTNWGLFISRSIITEHGGQIEIESEVGRGTTARVVLPLQAAI